MGKGVVMSAPVLVVRAAEDDALWFRPCSLLLLREGELVLLPEFARVVLLDAAAAAVEEELRVGKRRDFFAIGGGGDEEGEARRRERNSG